MSYQRLALDAQKDQQSVNGLLYTTPAAKTDIRRTFREKCGWVGPEERQRLAQLREEGGHADA